jgi:hypothetical protein
LSAAWLCSFIFPKETPCGHASDVDAAIERQHLPAAIAAAGKVGLSYRHVAGVDMLVDASQSRARSAIHFVFLHEKVRLEYEEAVPASTPDRTSEGILLAPVGDLVRMKLTSYRLKDRVHIQDLDAVGLITSTSSGNCRTCF